MLTGPIRRSGFRRDLTAQRFGTLVVVGPSHSDGRRWYWKTICDCGKENTTLGKDLTRKCRGLSGCRSCSSFGKNATHGLSQHPAFAVWRSMCDRCRLPTHQAWRNYGGRGITVCSHWAASFQAFWDDMGASYSRGLCLERVDNDGDYGPENCKWATYHEQARNTRRSRHIETPKGRMLLAEAAEVSGLGKTTLSYRLKQGWSVDRLFDPVVKGRC